MAQISVLDSGTINKIAAGEVIERPASVVKELLENAIDAQATAVTVEIRDGGISLIRITDNGCGIPKDQVPLAFLRHATSKIHTVDDLLTVSSLGFRGEALASIAAVSQVELISKTSSSLTASRYEIHGGVEKGIWEIGAPEGTTILARNLFFNTPARKKFLKTAATEGSHVAAVVEKIALSHPDISVRFIQNGQNKLYTSGNNNLKDLIYTVFGREITANLLQVSSEEPGFSITGYIGKPVIARSNRSYENYFINGRYVKSGLISKAIEEAYKPFMMQHKYPFTMLHFQIDPQTLDVNVHPTKMELRFSDGERVYERVRRALTETLSRQELIPEIHLEEQKESAKKLPFGAEPFERQRRESLLNNDPVSKTVQAVKEERPAAFLKQESEKKAQTVPVEQAPHRSEPLCPKQQQTEIQKPEPPKTAPPRQEPASVLRETSPAYQTPPAASRPQNIPENPVQMELFDGRLLAPESRKSHKLIGQLFDTYWLVEYDRQLYIIDQHAAHEKVLYERTLKSLANREHGSQMVEPPIILTLSMKEELLMNKYMEYFTRIGFEIEPFGGREFAVRGVPSNLFSIAKKELLLEMIDGLSEELTAGNPDTILERIASMSCKAAVKGGHTLSAMEANELIDQLLTLENPYACPHGRPTIVSMSQYELEKKFKRIV